VSFDLLKVLKRGKVRVVDLAMAVNLASTASTSRHMLKQIPSLRADKESTYPLFSSLVCTGGEAASILL
jgi:hypothetical protein